MAEEYHKEYYQKNKEKLREYNRQYYKNNIDKRRQQANENYARHRFEILKRMKRRREEMVNY